MARARERSRASNGALRRPHPGRSTRPNRRDGAGGGGRRDLGTTRECSALALFLSTSVHRIDKKGRVSVPAPFRAALEGESFKGVALCPPLTALPCLEGSGMGRIEAIAAAIGGLNPLAEETDALATAVLASVRQAPFDSEGRIVLGEDLIAQAGLSDRALFAGLGAKFQIWAPEAFEARQREALALARRNADKLPWGDPAATHAEPKTP